MNTELKTIYIGIIGLALAILVVSVTILIAGNSCKPGNAYIIASLIALELAGIGAVFGLFMLMKSRLKKHARKTKYPS